MLHLPYVNVTVHDGKVLSSVWGRAARLIERRSHSQTDSALGGVAGMKEEEKDVEMIVQWLSEIVRNRLLRHFYLPHLYSIMELCATKSSADVAGEHSIAINDTPYINYKIRSSPSQRQRASNARENGIRNDS